MGGHGKDKLSKYFGVCPHLASKSSLPPGNAPTLQPWATVLHVAKEPINKAKLMCQSQGLRHHPYPPSQQACL